jgi:hypothetical protein
VKRLGLIIAAAIATAGAHAGLPLDPTEIPHPDTLRVTVLERALALEMEWNINTPTERVKYVASGCNQGSGLLQLQRRTPAHWLTIPWVNKGSLSSDRIAEVICRTPLPKPGSKAKSAL